MITLTDYNGKHVHVNPQDVSMVKQADPASTYHGIRSYVKMRDGATLEVNQPHDWILNKVNEAKDDWK